MLLKKGFMGEPVRLLQGKLNRAGYPCGVADGIFGAITDRAVRAFQVDHGLSVDGVVGNKTLAILDGILADLQGIVDTVVDTFKEVRALPSTLPVTNFDKRISESIKLQQTCDNGQGCRYGGWINPYLFDKPEFDVQKKFVIPLVGKIVPGNTLVKPLHGGTCSPWASLMMAHILCANSDYNFRIGRSAFDIANADFDHVFKNSLIPGFGDYCEVEGVRRLEKIPMNTLYKHWEWMRKVNFVEMEHHCVIVLKVGGNGLNLEDPANPGKPLQSGLYRWGADGYYPKKDVDGDGTPEKYYSGTKQTFRLIEQAEGFTQGWDFYRVMDVDPVTCSPVGGPWKGRDAWPIVLE